MFKKRSEIFDSNFVYFMIITLFIMIRIISSTFNISGVMSYVMTIIIQIGLMFCLSIFLFSYLRKQKVKKTLNDYGFKKINWKSIIYSVLIGIIVYILTVFIATFFSAFLSLFGYESSSVSSSMTSYPIWLLVLELIFTAVLPGICEETAHRGMLLNSYKSLGAKKAILLSGFLFGLMHLNIEQFFYATIIGFFFGFIALATDSIYPTMIMHFVNNAVSTYIGFSTVNKLPLGTAINNFFATINSSAAFIGIMIVFLTMMILALLLSFLVVRLCKETKIRRLSQVADKILKEQLRNEIMQGIEEDTQPSNDYEISEQRMGDKRILNINLGNGLIYIKNSYKPNFKDNIFLIVNLFMGIITTFCTFIWGII